ncbi:hypothetical protein ACFY1L_23885 [Streptomyces sp. NPDC001663]|uniref:hypothetical protein n=1 Tax=Streptomyces sp. NPDC001663 TaxID=3364597 RepID=UPI0036B5691A
MNLLKRAAPALVTVALMFGAAGLAAAPALAAQPGVECDEFPNSPGHASSAPGSAFHEGGVAGQHYAGEQPQNSNNTHSVSQYDVACEKVSAH